MNTEETTNIITTQGPAVAQWAIQPTSEAVVTPWFEVFAPNDPRGGPTSAGIIAIDEEGCALSAFNGYIEIKGPGDMPITFFGMPMPPIFSIAVGSHFRINKPETNTPMGYVLLGYGASTTATD